MDECTYHLWLTTKNGELSCSIELDQQKMVTNVISLSQKCLIGTLNILEPAINNYFSKLNEGNYEAVSNLFSIEGCLYPPFEKEICGRAAIAQYLKSEAKDIQALPKNFYNAAHL